MGVPYASRLANEVEHGGGEVQRSGVAQRQIQHRAEMLLNWGTIAFDGVMSAVVGSRGDLIDVKPTFAVENISTARVPHIPWKSPHPGRVGEPRLLVTVRWRRVP